MYFPVPEGLSLLQLMHLFHGLNAVMAYVLIRAEQSGEFE